jgi:hypothetical protein
MIENTDKDLIYPGRWLVTFDPEKNLFASRGRSVEIDSNTLKIKWLNIVFKDVQELIYAANLINRFKEKYPDVHDFSFWSRLWLGLGGWAIYCRQEWLRLNTRVLDLDMIKKNFPSILDAKNNVQDEFINYINRAT